ncbi:glycine oxidase ThiO [Paenibacillus gansuensis]|uniref:glycine oxidase n=1 Tax=Paenibacillus gansuensis TaxID=306542 RepID=A0ABW5P7P2_9BACL
MSGETNERAADLIIVGGGVIGCSAAFYAAKRGLKVIVIDGGSVGGEASGAAAGMLGAQGEMLHGGPLFPLARRSRAMFPALVEELEALSGISVGYVNEGMLKPAFDGETRETLLAGAAFQRNEGERAEWLEPEEVLTMEPRLSRSLLGALYLPSDGQVSAPELTRAYVYAAKALGAAVREYEPALELLMDYGRCRGIRTPRKTYYGNEIVLACGAWASVWLNSQGLDSIESIPIKGECLMLQSAEPLITRTVFSRGCYLVPKRGNRTLIGATSYEGCTDRSLTVNGVQQLLNAACSVVPSVQQASWERGWTGIRPGTEDGLPVIGRHPQAEGLLAAYGHYRNGILLSPVTGELIAELAAGRSEEELGIGAFGFGRNAAGEQVKPKHSKEAAYP